MTNRELQGVTCRTGRCVRMLPCILLCALWLRAVPTHAQALTAEAHDSPPSAPVAAAPPPSALQSGVLAPREQVALVRQDVEQARFDVAVGRAQALLADPRLAARERNDTLELLAIAQLAGRHEQSAQATLSALFARDPEHPQRVRDPGPNVEAFFARVRAQQRPSVAAQLEVTAMRDLQGRVLVEVALGAAHDAVDSVHVFSRAQDAAAGARPSPAVEASSLTGEQPSHVVSDVAGETRVRLALPALSPASQQLALYVEARAPSGYVLARDGSAAAPLRVRLEPASALSTPPSHTPLRRSWWLWTSLAIVAAGAGVTGALIAQ